MKLYIHTIGCQMNVYDSEQISLRLQTMGYSQTEKTAEADLIILNTCAIREKAEQKVFSFLGRLAPLKKKNPGLVIGVGGCVAQQEGKKIMSRMPFVNLVFGTRALDRLPDLIQQARRRDEPVVDVDMDGPMATLPALPQPGQAGICRFVTVMRGCDNYCNYCVVPYVRGREVSRNPETVLGEIQGLVDVGVREVTLLGQNVNSYGQKEGFDDFSRLLARVNAIKGLSRIRFTTSHPKDLSEGLIHAFKELDKLCHHIHLPVQSGSNTVLRRMNRKYTRESYLEKLDKLRLACPGISVTSDFIVGFPGETEKDFNQTLDLIRAVDYDGLFAFKYSDRPSAPSVRFPGKVDETVKKERLQALLNLQEEATFRKNGQLVGSVQEVLVEGRGRPIEAPGSSGSSTGIQWTGRTSGNKIVNFSYDGMASPGNDELAGSLVSVTIERALAHSLRGCPVDEQDLAESA